MKNEKISKNCDVFIYNELKEYTTNIFLIEKKSKIFLIDTFCGSESMIPIKKILADKYNSKEVIVINTHFHWDHVWGNSSFKKNIIISHKLCREILNEHWEEQFKKNENYILGSVEKSLPNLTFKGSINFPDEGIEIFYSPGHTVDSISIFDYDEKILYVGDNLEKPIIYVEHKDIDTYIQTLNAYLGYKFTKIMAGHTLNLTEKDIYETIKYLNDLKNGNKFEFESKYMRKIHQQNYRFIHK
ncbi:MBL fold metallo-hydrolase [Clostridium pasteurianum]|uniref:Zn-dependent hydrolase, glyoxylase n=1 Tax=Clostridium pasteurianum BC1 TaxID=86416 RepID=R4KC60_CLOPA|nr:MBL fold metallo-hydrolase [Clostridium pasteurianum]AGK97210.1 Zn-dependent hydrolase, glyoxylase [Clostridium pasteurianum BC1]